MTNYSEPNLNVAEIKFTSAASVTITEALTARTVALETTSHKNTPGQGTKGVSNGTPVKVTQLKGTVPTPLEINV